MAGPLEQFVIKPIIPIEVGGVDISFTNSALWMVIAIVVSTSFFSLAMRRKSLVPGRLQYIAEYAYNFIAGMVRENIGPKGRQFFPFVFTLYMTVMCGNLLGMFPFSFTYTSHIIVTGALAILVMLVVIIMGLINFGPKFLQIFAPSGVPIIMMPLVVPIEIASFLSRPLTLSVRLFANMMAGHLVLKVFAGFCVMPLAIGALGLGISVLPMIFTTIMIGFEYLIAVLHAYIFTVLSCIYLHDAVELHH